MGRTLWWVKGHLAFSPVVWGLLHAPGVPLGVLGILLGPGVPPGCPGGAACSWGAPGCPGVLHTPGVPLGVLGGIAYSWGALGCPGGAACFWGILGYAVYAMCMWCVTSVSLLGPHDLSFSDKVVMLGSSCPSQCST